MQEWTLHRTKLQCQREEANEEIHYAIAIVKRTVECKNWESRYLAMGQLAACLFLQQNGNIECTITGARRFSPDSPVGGLELPCAQHFSWWCKS